MFRIRTTPTKSGATAVQVVKYVNRRTVVIKHLGSGYTSSDVGQLKEAASTWITRETQQLSMFRDSEFNTRTSPVLVINQSKLISAESVFIYEVLDRLCQTLDFNTLLKNHPECRLLLDLVIMRLISPGSKLAALRMLDKQFGISYQPTTMYRQLPKWEGLQTEVEELLVKIAKRQFNFDFSLVFYDVTTLYFETDKSDQELKLCGFSKDHKFNQPQIVVGLVVSDQGFPIGYGVFPGNKFEGHTFIPIIDNFRQKHQIKQFTIVADAAMISQDNVDKLIARKLHYIVGARMGNLSLTLIKQIHQKLNRADEADISIVTPRGNLICTFSQKRYRKDKHETEKQIDRAKQAIQNPGKRKRFKFLTQTKDKPQLNQKLIKKTKMLWGIKGYYTNLTDVSNKRVIEHYQNLWQVEKSFRITKSDLQARPIYHHKTKAIKAHLLICVMALAIAKYLEITTKFSVKKCIDMLATIKDAKIKNQNGQIVTLRSNISNDVGNLLQKLNLSY